MSEKPGLISYLFSKKGKLMKEKQDLDKEISDLNLEKDVIAKRTERDKLRKEIADMAKARIDSQRKENPPPRKTGEAAKARGKGREESKNVEDEAEESTEIGV